MAVDKMAYLVKGKDIGFISLSRDTSPDYGYYEQMKKDWQSYGEQLEVYNEQVRAYTKEISGKVYYIETPEWEGIKQWESWLTQQRTMIELIREQLEYVWNSHGTVNSIEIYW